MLIQKLQKRTLAKSHINQTFALHKHFKTFTALLLIIIMKSTFFMQQSFLFL